MAVIESERCDPPRGQSDLTSGQRFPFAGFVGLTWRQACSQMFKAILHLATTLPLGQFVGHSQFRRSAVRSGAIW